MKRPDSPLCYFHWMLAMLLSLLLLSGCANSTEEDNTTAGKLAISLTDAAGDFTRYSVDVTALKLYRSNGAIVETLPNTTTLDFSQYVDVSEFLTIASVPPGAYSKAEITLDFSQADIQVENSQGESIPASALDENGNPLGVITLSTLINATEGFEIIPGQPASLVLDFDLAASNEVSINTSDDAATITVNPVLIANTSLDEDKQRRLRGLLDSVNVDAQSFVVDIRPFRVRNRSFGQITVQIDADSLFEIDGENYDAETGMNALAELDPLTPLVTLGQFDIEQQRYTASQVYAGSSVPWDNLDAVKGSVIARSGNTLTVLGAAIELRDGRFLFNDEISVQIGDATRVHKQGSTDPASIADISIGQRVTILGQMNDVNFDASDEGSIVRMRYSDVSGIVVSASPLQIDLQSINRRSVQRYDFSGSGIDSTQDADPDQYEIDSGSLPLEGLQNLDPLHVRGFPTPFATAPLDFTAKTIIDAANTRAEIFVGYGYEGSDQAIVTLDDQGLQLDLETSSGRHVIKQSGIVSDLTLLPAMPLIAPYDGFGLYSIHIGRSLEVFRNWADFAQAVNERLDDQYRVELVIAKGTFDQADNRLDSRTVLLRLTN